MIIKLNKLIIKNFKGIKNVVLDSNGKDLAVYGDNAVGKTTIACAWNWLLFDKDSNDKADTNFTIKPQNELGQDINNLQTLVEAELLVDGNPIKIKKTREEKWTKPHGATEKVFDGHTKFYWFNEVPLKATPYKAKIDELVDENIFKMITNPLYFNTKLKWEERREILLQISGDKTNEEVIASDESLAKLTELLKGRSIDDYKLVLADQLKNYKKERDNIPPRIDELTRSLPQIEPDYTETERELEKFKDGLSQIESNLTNISNSNNEINKKYQELSSLKVQLEEVKTKIKAESSGDRLKMLGKKRELEEGKFLIESAISALKMQIDQANRTLENNISTRGTLLSTYKELGQLGETIRAKKFEDNAVGVSTDCPTCNQKLPIEIVQGKMTELKANFEKDIKERLDALQIRINSNMAEGKGLKEHTEKTQLQLSKFEEELSFKENNIAEINKSLSILEIELGQPITEPDYTKSKEIAELSKKIDDLCYELDKPVEDKSSELLQRKSELQSKIDECNKVLNDKEETEKKKARIEELKADEKRVSTLIAELEGNKYLLERFIVAKVNLLEDSINNQFKHVKFKLFEENVTNDGIKETCVALINTNGSYVEFLDANDAGKINAGIDIINSLCKFYGVNAPIFTDNAESVTDFASTESQLIKLIKPEIRDEYDRDRYSRLVVEVKE